MTGVVGGVAGTVVGGVPRRVGILGAGRMGAGIAHAFLLAGAQVAVVERDADAASAGRARIVAAIRESVARQTTPETESELAARLTVGTDVAVCAGAGLVVEAVAEDFVVKAELLGRAEAAVRSGSSGSGSGSGSGDAWLASNTSSLSISDLAATLARPERFCGLHFFNPVPASELVEIVVGSATLPTLVEAARGWVTAIGKQSIVVTDSPGFASSRLGVAIGLEAIRMLEDGVASAADIDTAMVLGYRFPVGPLRLTDMVGLDVRLGIAEYLHETLGERFEPPRLLRELVAKGSLGRKTGQGFFAWPAEPNRPDERPMP